MWFTSVTHADCTSVYNSRHEESGTRKTKTVQTGDCMENTVAFDLEFGCQKGCKSNPYPLNLPVELLLAGDKKS